ncbi:MAG: PAS domain-containing protein, partial [Deltaproteobacteria bacterium]|nr:PAS domain-containing protein [Deltaproteobacteria bacterium]
MREKQTVSLKTISAKMDGHNWLKSIVENSLHGIYVINDQQQLIFANQAMCDLLGYSIEELLGQNFQMVLTEESIKIVTEHYQKRQRGEPVPSSYQFSIHRKNGEKKWVETSSTVAHDNDGLPITIGNMIDISWKKEAEAELRESEEKFRVAFSTSPDAIMLTKLEDGKCIEVNEGFLQLTGYTTDEVIGKETLEFNLWRNPENRNQLIKGIKEKGFIKNLEAEFVAKNGGIIYGLMSGRAIEISGEKFILTVTRDISERKLAEEKYSTLISEASIGIGMASADTGEILECNNAFTEMLGYLKDELIGQFQSKIDADPLVDGKVTSGFAEHRDSAKGEMLERKLITKSGQILDVEVKATQLNLSGKNVLLGFFHDISERKKE